MNTRTISPFAAGVPSSIVAAATLVAGGIAFVCWPDSPGPSAVGEGAVRAWGSFLVPGAVAGVVVLLRRPRIGRATVAILLCLSAAVWVGYRAWDLTRAPRPGVPAGLVAEFTGRATHDLRPSSDRSRRLQVELHGVRTAEGWAADAGGIVEILWSGDERVADHDRTRSRIPIRGDTITVAEPLPENDRAVWTSDGRITADARGRGASTRGTVREGIRRRLARLPSRSRSIVLALLMGTRGDMPAQLIEEVRRAGAAHVVALSGMHLGVLAAIIGRLVPRRVPKTARRIGLAAALCLYVWIAGWIPSLVRALVLIMLGLAAAQSERPAPAEVLLARCVLVVAAIAPLMILSPGFQLSVLALIGIFCLAPRLAELLSELLPRPLAVYLGTTAGAMAATAPYSLAVFGTLFPGGLLSAGVLSLLVMILMWAALAYLAVATLPLVGTGAVAVVGALGAAFERSVGLFARIPGIELGRVGSVESGILWALLVLGMLAGAAARRRMRRRRLRNVMEHRDEPQFSY